MRPSTADPQEAPPSPTLDTQLLSCTDRLIRSRTQSAQVENELIQPSDEDPWLMELERKLENVLAGSEVFFCYFLKLLLNFKKNVVDPSVSTGLIFNLSALFLATI
jgi:hypothetical protein